MDLGYQNIFYLKQPQQKQQSLYNGKVLLEKHDPPTVYDSEETLQLAQEKADASPDKHKALEFDIEHLLRAVVSQDIMSVVQNNYVVNTSNLQTELDHLNGKSKDTPCASDTLDPLSRKLEDENVTRAQTKIITESLQEKLNDMIYENAKLRAQLFDMVSEQKDITKGVDNIAKTRRPHLRRNTKNDRVPYASKSNYIKNKEVEVEEHHRNLLLSKNKKHMSSECNNIKLAIRNDKYEVVCAMYSGCSKHMTGNLKLLINFIWKFLRTVRFGNDHIAAILGYGDLQWGNILITRVYSVDELGHNLFSVGQFCDSDLEVAFRRNTCYVRNLKGVDLLKGNRTTNLYTINLYEMASASPICLIARTTSTKSWLWHQCLSHLNFDTIND
ncbi:hypothetical protein Tco_0484067 [Tanacetum coccineum]